MLLEVSEHYKPPTIPLHILKQDIPRRDDNEGQLWHLCRKCKKKTISVDESLCLPCESKMTTELAVEISEEESSTKLCQHCIERGYSTPNKATKRWLNGHYACDECYSRLSAAITEIPSHFTDYLLESDDILKHRDEFFNHHHAAIVNLPLEEIHQRLEQYKRILFTVRIAAEDCQTIIEKAKREAKAKIGLPTELTKKKESLAGRQAKLSKEEKLQQSMARTLGISVDQLKALGKQAQKNELASATGTTVCMKCQRINCICKNKVEDSAPVSVSKRCPYCEAEVPSLLMHYKDCAKKPK